MKRHFIILSVALILLFLLSFKPIFAQEIATESGTQTQSTYELPYPGLLPDNPLYIFKTIRDRVVSFLINDPVKKAQFNLLTSDKRINAALSLHLEKRDDLVVTTISKSNNYFDEAITAAQKAKKAGYSTVDLFSKLHGSLNKHEEVLNDIEEGDKKDKKALESEKNRMKDFEKRIPAK